MTAQNGTEFFCVHCYKFVSQNVRICILSHVARIIWRRSQWPRRLRRGSAGGRLLVLWVRIMPGAWMRSLNDMGTHIQFNTFRTFTTSKITDI